MRRKILLIGTFDTKGEEYSFVRNLILNRGHEVLLLDISIMNDPPFPPHITSSKVAAEGGSNLKDLRNNADRGKAVEVMSSGVRALVPKLFVEGRFDGVLSLGGGTGTNIATAGMRELPVGIPKVMISSIASADVSPYVDIKDITMMYSVVDISGLNRLSRRILANAAGAICGMVEQDISDTEDKPLIAASMFGVTTPCVTKVRQKLEQAGYEVVVFHATGTGGRAMESLIRDGYFSGVADITTTEICDEVVGGVLSAGQDRLHAAGRKGLPQVISCGALDMVNFHAKETVPEQFKTRTFIQHNPNVTLMRTTPEECREIGKVIAKRLNKSKGPVLFLLPLRGLSMIDKQDQPFHDPQADQALFEALRQYTEPHIKILDADMHINDASFASLIADELISLLKKKPAILNN
ncbi:MAG: Tm-1-like ATP-binding domain-containing protein [Balneolales bacterium]